MSERSLQLEIRAVISEALPPVSPIVVEGWSALAFDRNRYEDLAPADVWRAWFGVHRSSLGNSPAIGVASFSDVASGDDALRLEASLDALNRYWTEDARFLVDHYVFSYPMKWLVRLDQDVTLFVAEKGFMHQVVERLGGLDCVFKRMVEDFDPGDGDPVGLNAYLVELTSGLRRAS